jgi:membrane-bound lytic murein transglycosylase D
LKKNCSQLLVFFIFMGLIRRGVADRVSLNLVALVTNWKSVCALIAAILALTLGGCAPSADVQSDPATLITVSGQADASNLTGADAAQLPDARDTLMAGASYEMMPFVRSQPKSVPPFPLVLNRTVQQYVNQYAAQPQGLKRSFRRSQPYMPEMVRVMENAGLPPDLVYLAFAESGFSAAGDGPWQLEKDTARRFGLVVNDWIDERRDPLKSTRAAAEYLATLHDATGSDWRMTLVAWNNGDGTIDHYSRLRSASYDRLMRKLPQRTRCLMNRFMAVALIARHASDYGLDDVNFAEPPHYKILRVKGGTLLSHISEMTNVTVDAIRQANPAILRDRVPADIDSYDIRVPDGELQAQLNEF